MTRTKRSKVKSHVRKGRRVKGFIRKHKGKLALGLSGAAGVAVAMRAGLNYNLFRKGLKKSPVFNDNSSQGRVLQFKTGEILKEFDLKDEYRSEVKALEKLKGSKFTPKLIAKSGLQNAILIERLEGTQGSNWLKANVDNPERMGLFSKNLRSAIDDMHSRGVAHQDLHANNILVGRDNSVKIIDFGLSSTSKKISKSLAKADENKISTTVGYYLNRSKSPNVGKSRQAFNKGMRR